jgi:glucose-specific phosphotransferase system IIA component
MSVMISIKSPLSGKLIPITEVADETFSEKILGDGFAIDPIEGKLRAPVDSKVIQVFRTGHAIGLLTQEGLEILVHIGLDTVKMKGDGFRPLVKVGQFVKAGDELLEFDLEKIKQHGKPTVSPVIFTNMDKIREFQLNLPANELVKIGDEIATITLS